jgi:hypothetical protein
VFLPALEKYCPSPASTANACCAILPTNIPSVATRTVAKSRLDIISSEDILIKTKDIVQELGYQLVYADTDSVFIKKKRRWIMSYLCFLQHSYIIVSEL